jgi:YHS domain-containing protein
MRVSLMSHQAPVFVLALVVLGCSPEPEATPKDPVQAGPEPTASEAKAPAEGALTRVEPGLVCMINNQFMDKPQIPVEVEGTTYYGCCEMCKTKLAEDPASRAAVDPVSGAKVDKAHAVIGKNAAGAVFYFENEQNLAAYVAPAG